MLRQFTEWAGRLAFHGLRRHPRLVRTVLPWMLTRMSCMLPVKKLRETPSLLAFYHPQPTYAVHILIVPRRAVASLLELSGEDAALLGEVTLTVQSLVRELNLERMGYRLIVNGGVFQDLPQLHWHLVAGQAQSDPA